MAPRTPLLRPDRFFAEREPTIPRVAVLFLVLLLAGPTVVYGVGWVLTANVDGTVMVDNPERPPDWFCDDQDGDSVFDQSDCDAPEQVERDVDTVLWDAFDQFVGPAFVAYPLAAALTAALLHAGVKLVGAGRGLFRTFAIATWGLVPSLLLAPLTIAAMAALVDPVTVAPGDDPGRVLEPIEVAIEQLRPFTTVGTVLTALWGGVIWRFGLYHEQELRGTEATLVAGVVTLLAAGVGLL